jgi:tripartite-type tricarboxylate transporter receptor subunit TctC
MREVIVRAVIAFIASCCGGPARRSRSEEHRRALPHKPIRLIVPFAPGGTNDILARMVAQHLNQTWGQAVIADNRAGAEGIIGTDLAVKARPDGYTLVVISSAYTMNPVVMKLPVRAAHRARVRREDGFELPRAGRGAVAPGQFGEGSHRRGESEARPDRAVELGRFLHFASALFTSMSKEKFNIVLYKGGAPAMMDILAGQTHAGFQASVPVLPHLKSGKLKVLPWAA